MALVEIHIYNLGGLCEGGCIKVMLPIYIIPGKAYLGQNWEEVSCPQYFSKWKYQFVEHYVWNKSILIKISTF